MVKNDGANSILKGVAITVVMRWTDRLIGLISTLILARLLAPDDIGIIAMASLVIGFIDVFLDLGVNIALIQNRNAEAAHFNTAWTLRLVQSSMAALIIVLASSAAAAYFKDARIAPVLHVMAASLIVAAFENIGIVTFQKEMKFGLEFRFLFAKRLVGFLVTVTAAWFLRSYWALVIGTLAGRAFGTALSYGVHPMRPRISFEKIHDILSVSLWVLVRSIGSYLDNNLHKIVVGGRSSASIIGAYSIADDIAAMPTSEILAPLNRVLFPAFVQVKHDVAELARLFLLAQGVQTLIAVPASVGLAVVAADAVNVLLGDRWLFAVPFVQVLALSNAIQAIYTSGGYVMITLGNMRYIALLTWVQVTAFVVTVTILMPDASALQVAWVRVLVVLAGLSLAIWLLMRTLRVLTLRVIIQTIARPMAATAVMAFAVIWLGNQLALSPLTSLIAKIGLGAAVYSITVVLLWTVCGKPQGAESFLLEKARLLIGVRNSIL